VCELRIDPFSNSKVLFHEGEQYCPPKIYKPPLVSEPCPFCPGNEHIAPPAVYVLSKRDGNYVKSADTHGQVVKDWIVRVFPSAHPVFFMEAKRSYGNFPFEMESAYGLHCIAAIRRHESFYGVSAQEWEGLLFSLRENVHMLYKKKGITYVSVFINEGHRAGALLAHPHVHVVAMPFIPPLIAKEIRNGRTPSEGCVFCTILSHEKNGPRHVFSTEKFTAFSPWAPRHPYEVWIFPIKHSTHFSRMSNEEIEDLAKILSKLLSGLSRAVGEVPFSLVFHLSPEKRTAQLIHWHTELYPKLEGWRSLEKGYGIHSHTVTPERAAALISAHIPR